MREKTVQPFRHTGTCQQCQAASDLRFLRLIGEGAKYLFATIAVVVIAYSIYALFWVGA